MKSWSLQQPAFTTMAVQTTVVCPDGGTVLLGGLKTLGESRNEFGPPFLSKAFVICILGGVGSVPGAALGGLIFGMLESFGAVFFGAEYALTLAFIVLIILLLVRPHGLLGVKGF